MDKKLSETNKKLYETFIYKLQENNEQGYVQQLNKGKYKNIYIGHLTQNKTQND